MCGGEESETKMEKLLFTILEETPIILMDSNGNVGECSAEDLAKELQTTPQVVGKVMKYCDDFWTRIVRKGKVIYVPVEVSE
jgi:hypothetical protein